MKAKASSTRTSKKTRTLTRQRGGGARPRADKLSAALFQIADAASAAQNLQEFYATIHRIVGKLMYAENFILQVYDDATQMVSYPYVVDTTSELRAVRPVPLAKIRKGFAIRVLQTGATLHIGRAQMDAMVQRGEVASIGADAEDWVGVPLKIEGRTLGVLVVQSYRADMRYRAADVRVLEFVAQHIAIALTRARALEETRQRVAELAIINNVQHALASQLDIQAIYDLVGDTVRDIFDLQTVIICTFDLAHELEIFHYNYEQGRRYYPVPRQYDATRKKLIESREPILVNRVTPEFLAQVGGQTIEGTPIPKAGIFAPMIVRQEIKGYVSIQNLERFDAFSDSDVRLLQTLANAMSVALENARLFDELQTRHREITEALEQQTATSEILRVIAQSPTNVQPVLDVIVEHAVKLCDASFSNLYRTDGKMIYEAAQYNFPKEAVDESQRLYPAPLAKDRISSRCILERSIIHIPNMGEDASLPKVTRRYVNALKMNCLVMIPLMREEEAIGCIGVGKTNPDPYTDKQVALLKTFADQAVIAIENVRLFNETKRLLSETQQRAAELAIINSVQQGLASKLEMQAVYDLVGEKIREIFDAQAVMMVTFDYATERGHINYMWEKGARYYPAPSPFTQFIRHIIRTRQIVLFNDDFQRRAQEFGMHLIAGDWSKSAVYVPLIVGEVATGLISLHNMDRENAFSESDVRLLETLTNAMSIALENARLFAETNQRAAELAIINSVGAALAQQLELQRVIELVGEKIRDVFDAQAVGIALHDQKHKQIVYPYTWNRGRRLDLPSGKVGGLGGHVIKTRQPLVINRNFAQRAAEYRSRLMVGPDYPKAGVYVPILIGENVLGTLTLLNYERENVFADSDVRLIETIAANMGVAIQNARLFEELQVSLTTTTRLAELSAQMLTATSVEETARFVTRALQEAFAADVVSVDLLEANGEFRYWDSDGLPDEFYQRGQPRPDGLTHRAMDLAEPLIIQTPELLSPATRALGVQSTIALPLRDEKSSLGVLFLNYRAAREFDQREIDALSLFANQTALAVKRLRLIEETQQRAAELAIINGMGDALAGQIELDALIQLVGDKLRATFRADIVYIALLDRATNSIHFPYYNEHGHARVEPPLAFGHGLTSKIIETRQPLLMNQDLEKKRSELGVARQGTPARAYLGVPILVGDEAIGAISVQSTAQENRFGDAEQRLLTTIAAGVGVAMERARLYQTTQNQKQYFEALVQNSPVAIVTIDLGTRVTEWNPAAERLFGYTRAEALGNNIDDLVARDESLHAEATGYSQRGITQGGIFHAITKRQRKDGSRVDVDMWGVPIFVGAQRVGVYAMYVDITELEYARREAIAANDAKSAFLATMSHEIRTPMNAIIGMSGLLLNTNLTNDQREFAEIVRSSGEGLLTIINDILDFSKIEAAKMELERAPFDLRDALESSLDLVAATAAEKGLDLACVIEDGTPAAIIGDITRVRQILLNLLNNAVKFTEQGEVVLEVGNWKLEAGSVSSSSNLHFSVRDTGIGIPPDRIDRLFQSFTQVDASTTRKYGGTGLGLAISKRLVELMGGAMWVESASGVGTTFHFTLPIQVAPEFTPRVRVPRDHSRLTGKRVLIVDDNATNRRILVLQTRGWGMIARDTASPREALEWIQNHEPFDLAILDMQMPEMDGLQLARAIREQRDARALPLVMFSSLGQRNAETDALGFVAFLKKPLKQSQLLDALIGIFGAREPAPQTSVAPHFDAEMATRIPLRILLTEDNAVNQKLALRLLSQLGYRADIAANGIETLRAIERQQYDVVLMDVQMPEMDGLEATRAIRKGGVTPSQHQPRIIAMTANAMQGDREMCLAAGMDDYISKPIRVDELIRALSESQRDDWTRSTADERG